MARARSLKYSFFTNDKLAELPPLARLLFAGLWCLADREGRLEDRPRRIKAELLPYDDCDVDALLAGLAAAGFIVRYIADGARLIQIVNFLKHQDPHYKEKASSIPAFDGDHRSIIVQSSANDSPTINQSSTDDSSSVVVTSPLTLDSGLLTPDSRTPLSKSQATIDVISLPISDKPSKLRQEATNVLAYLNELSGRFYRPETGTLKPIMARLKGGYSARELRAVVDAKVIAWGKDDKMRAYLRPATLFGAEKFAQYVGEIPPIEELEHAASN